MTMTNPITPPPELRRQWLDNDDFPFVAGTNDLLSIAKDRLNSVMDQAAQWGADQELEACVKWIEDCGYHLSVSDEYSLLMRMIDNQLRAIAAELEALDD